MKRPIIHFTNGAHVFAERTFWTIVPRIGENVVIFEDRGHFKVYRVKLVTHSDHQDTQLITVLVEEVGGS